MNIKKFQTNNGFFEGEVDNNGIPNGKGKFEHVGGFNDGDKYIGEFKDGQPHGQGEFIWAHGKRYIGQFTEGSLTGRGVMIFDENHSEMPGDRWEGLFKNGFPDLDDKNFKMIKAHKKRKKTKSEKIVSDAWGEVLNKNINKIIKDKKKKVKTKISWDSFQDDFFKVMKKNNKNKRKK